MLPASNVSSIKFAIANFTFYFGLTLYRPVRRLHTAPALRGIALHDEQVSGPRPRSLREKQEALRGAELAATVVPELRRDVIVLAHELVDRVQRWQNATAGESRKGEVADDYLDRQNTLRRDRRPSRAPRCLPIYSDGGRRRLGEAGRAFACAAFAT